MFTLAKFDAAKRALAEARRLHEVKAIRDKAEALRLYFKQQANGLLLQNQAAELKLRAERKAGDLLTEMEKAKGGGDGSNQYRKSNQCHDVTGCIPTLAAIGITRKQSSRWQQVASIPKQIFEQFIKDTKQAGEELTTRALLELRFASTSSTYSSAYGTMSPGTVHATQEKLPHYVELKQGDTLSVLKTFPDESIDMVLTSPPYYGLRDYGAEGQIGLEPTLDEYLEKMLAVTAELKRVLKRTGTMWWNHGDSYGSGIQNERRMDSEGDEAYNRLRRRNLGVNFNPILSIPEKSLLLQAHRLAIRMIDEQGWILRNIIIWHKPNCMPSSVEDRFSVDFEPIFFFTKSQKYFFERQYEPYAPSSDVRYRQALRAGRSYNTKQPYRNNTPYMGRYKRGQGSVASRGDDPDGLVVGGHNAFGRNKRCVWTIPTQPFPDAHFAVYPSELCEIPIKAGCPEYVCTKCGEAREKMRERKQGVPTYREFRAEWERKHPTNKFVGNQQQSRKGSGEGGSLAAYYALYPETHESKEYSNCGCDASQRPGVVLDPFFGSGSTAIAASALGRSWIGIELSEEYIQMAKRRLMQHGIYPTPTEKLCL